MVIVVFKPEKVILLTVSCYEHSSLYGIWCRSVRRCLVPWLEVFFLS